MKSVVAGARKLLVIVNRMRYYKQELKTCCLARVLD
jgi:hypothetical protein